MSFYDTKRDPRQKDRITPFKCPDGHGNMVVYGNIFGEQKRECPVCGKDFPDRVLMTGEQWKDGKVKKS
ncbi:MAG TPA: hypothetical protein ENH82_09920 [bacterium]|nr:hypothetical protein [bacterium]